MRDVNERQLDGRGVELADAVHLGEVAGALALEDEGAAGFIAPEDLGGGMSAREDAAAEARALAPGGARVERLAVPDPRRAPVARTGMAPGGTRDLHFIASTIIRPMTSAHWGTTALPRARSRSIRRGTP